jgi:PAS domain S-box-containing protein
MSEERFRGPARLLVVDDTEANRYAVVRHLRMQGFDVTEAATGRDAIESVRLNRPDLVILDIRLPDISGLEITRTFRSDPRTASIPILHISASFTDTASKARGLDNGADGYLTHPVDPPVMLATVRALLRAHTAEREVAEAARQWAATFNAIGDGVCVTDLQGRIQRCNRAFEDLLGFKCEPDDPRPVWELAPLLTALATTAESRQTSAGQAVRIDSGDRTLRASVAFTPADEDASAGAVWVVTDLTRERRADERIRRALQLETTGRLAGGVAHEVNNMMTAILSYAEFALSGFALDDPKRADIEGIHAAATRSAEVARQLLTFSRRQTIQPRTVDCHALIRSLKPSIHRLLGADKSLFLDFQAKRPWVAVDPVGFEQILINLALNARDAMPPGGRLDIRTRNVVLDASMETEHPEVAIRWGSYLQVEVSDTGHGMSRQTLERIFEPFFTTKEVGQGTGLGLATVYGMMKQSGGYIWAESEPERGAMFTLQLPEGQPEAMVPPPVVDETTPASGTLLLVEDEPVVLRLLARGLRDAGYRVVEAPDGRQGLDELMRLDGQVDAVVTDVIMPQMSGRELSAEIRARWPAIPILFMSGYTNDDVVGRGLLALGEEFLQKPFSPVMLTEKIQALMRAV